MTPKIMIVDDDTDSRDTIQEILTGEGMDVIAAKDGFEAIQMASENLIDLILMDIWMPGMDGVEALSEIKDFLPDCTVVMMTGSASEDHIQYAMSKGAKACLTKPLTIQQLLKIVGEVVPG